MRLGGRNFGATKNNQPNSKQMKELNKILSFASNMENLRQEVQRVFNGTSDRFVPETSRKAVQADILIAIRKFKNEVRWKEFWRNQKQSTKPEANERIEEESRFMATGLNTGLKPTSGVKTAKHGSDNLKGFLTPVEKPSSRRLLNADALNAKTEKQLKSTTSFKN